MQDLPLISQIVEMVMKEKGKVNGLSRRSSGRL